MMNILLACVLLLGVLSVCLLILLLRKEGVLDWSPVLQLFGTVQERTERAVREEFSRSRDESTRVAQRSREELGATLKNMGDTLHLQLTSLMQMSDQKLERVRETVENRLKALQEDNAKQLDQMRATVDEKLQGTL